MRPELNGATGRCDQQALAREQLVGQREDLIGQLAFLQQVPAWFLRQTASGLTCLRVPKVRQIQRARDTARGAPSGRGIRACECVRSSGSGRDRFASWLRMRAGYGPGCAEFP